MLKSLARPLFILSDFRTGSTMLRYALDAHPEICCPAELGIGPYCQALFRIAELTRQSELSRGETLRARLTMVRTIVDDVMSAYCARKGKRLWCEKSPENTGCLNVLGAVFPDAQYIVLYRHGLDQSRSFLAMDQIETRLQPFLTWQKGDIVAAAVERWCSQVEKLLAFEHLHHLSAHRIYYERFVDSPEEELTSVMSFLGVERIAGLSAVAFTAPHDHGPEDAKARCSTRIDSGRKGKGRELASKTIPVDLEVRFAGLLRTLGYPRLDGAS